MLAKMGGYNALVHFFLHLLFLLRLSITTLYAGGANL
jgi:hypothetical protein